MKYKKAKIHLGTNNNTFASCRRHLLINYLEATLGLKVKRVFQLNGDSKI